MVPPLSPFSSSRPIQSHLWCIRITDHALGGTLTLWPLTPGLLAELAGSVSGCRRLASRANNTSEGAWRGNLLTLLNAEPLAPRQWAMQWRSITGLVPRDLHADLATSAVVREVKWQTGRGQSLLGHQTHVNQADKTFILSLVLSSAIVATPVIYKIRAGVGCSALWPIRRFTRSAVVMSARRQGRWVFAQSAEKTCLGHSPPPPSPQLPTHPSSGTVYRTI